MYFLRFHIYNKMVSRCCLWGCLVTWRVWKLWRLIASTVWLVWFSLCFQLSSLCVCVCKGAPLSNMPKHWLPLANVFGSQPNYNESGPKWIHKLHPQTVQCNQQLLLTQLTALEFAVCCCAVTCFVWCFAQAVLNSFDIVHSHRAAFLSPSCPSPSSPGWKRRSSLVWGGLGPSVALFTGLGIGSADLWLQELVGQSVYLVTDDLMSTVTSLLSQCHAVSVKLKRWQVCLQWKQPKWPMWRQMYVDHA